ncbi:MAG TPA: hypothetical protein VHF24_05155 [Acidimicrobiales bacterium]|nr:hypothetical protein [Acidimicrobiales bacterium]
MKDRSPDAPADLEGPPPWYLLFGGLHQEAVGGLRSLRGVYAGEEEARSAFRRLRLERRSAPGWGELAVLEPSGRLRALCWFGVPSEAMAAHPAGSAGDREVPGTATDVPGGSPKVRLRGRFRRGAPPGAGTDVRAGASR